MAGEVTYNSQLPPRVRAAADQEGATFRNDILTGLADILRTHALYPSIGFWAKSIHKYLDLKYELPAADRVAMLRLLVEIVQLPDLDTAAVARICGVAERLLKKRFLNLTGLEIPWRFFYSFLHDNYFPDRFVFRYVERTAGENVVNFVRQARKYFAPCATDEILAELRPRLCVHDTHFFSNFALLSLFLPTNKWSAWLDEFFGLWEWAGHSRDWDLAMLSLLGRLLEDEPTAARDVGRYSDAIFTHVLAMCRVVVGTSKAMRVPAQPFPATIKFLLPTGVNGSAEMAAAADTILGLVAPLRAGEEEPAAGSALARLAKMLTLLDPYFHPSNGGEWTAYLGSLLVGLTEAWALRVGGEARNDCKTPAAERITEATSLYFARIVWSPILHGIHAKNWHMKECAKQAMQHLSWVAPAFVFDRLLPTVYPALETLTEAHRTLAAIEALACCAGSLVRFAHYPTGAAQLGQLMELTLAGIDNNDLMKTGSTLRFYINLVGNVPLIDVSSINILGLNEADSNAKRVTASFGDWTVRVVDRIIAIFKNMTTPASGWLENVVMGLINYFLEILFQQVSEDLFKLLMGRVRDFVLSSLHHGANDQMGALVEAAAYANPAAVLQALLPACRDAIATEVASGAGAAVGRAEASLLWHLRAAASACNRTGAAIVAHKDVVMDIIRLVRPLVTREVNEMSREFLQCVVRSLLLTYPIDSRSRAPQEWTNGGFTSTHWRSWGEHADVANLAIAWHEPSPAEVDMAIALLEAVKIPAMAFFDQALAGGLKAGADDHTTVQQQVLRELAWLRGVGEAALPFRDAEDDAQGTVETETDAEGGGLWVPLPRWRVAVGAANDHGLNMRDQLADKLRAILPWVRDSHADPAAMEIWVNVAEVVLIGSGAHVASLNARRIRHRTGKHFLRNAVRDEDRAFPRFLLVDRVKLQLYQRRHENSFVVQESPRLSGLINDVYSMAICPFSKVRTRAQTVLGLCDKRYPRTIKSLLPLAFNTLYSESKSSEEKVTGTLFLLANQAFMRKIATNVFNLSAFLPALCSSYDYDRPTTQARISQLHTQLVEAFRTQPLSLPPLSDHAAVSDLLGRLPSAVTADRAELTRRLAKRSDSLQGAYEKLNERLLQILTDKPNLHWRYQSYAAGALVFLLREDRIPSLGVVRFFLDSLVSPVEHLRGPAESGITRVMAVVAPVAAQRTLTVSGVTRVSVADWRSRARPTSEAEWNATEWSDPEDEGWYRRVTHAYPVGGQRQPLSEQAAAIRDLVGARLGDPEVVRRIGGFLENVARAGDEAFSAVRMELWRHLFKLVEDRAFASVRQEVDRLIAMETERAAQVAAAEILAGMVRGSKQWPYAAQKTMWEYVGAVVRGRLEAGTPDSTADWRACVMQMARDRDPRRMGWLVDTIFHRNFMEGGSTLQMSKTLIFLVPVLGEGAWRVPREWRELLELASKHLTHPLMQVREKLAGAMGMATWMLHELPRDPATLQAAPGLAQTQSDAYLAFESHLIATLDELTAKDVPGSEDGRKNLANGRKTLAGFVQLLFLSGWSAAVRPNVLLPHLLAACEDPEKETSDVAKAAMGVMSTTWFSEPTMDALLETVHTLAASAAWRARKELMPFLQQIIWGHVFLLKPDRVARVTDLLITMLGDAQLEVRELASSTLVGLLKFGDATLHTDLETRFTTMANTKIKKKKDAGLSEEAKAEAERVALIKRHAGVLGLAALLRLSPYDVPAWMPAVLVTVAGHVTDPMPVSGSVRAVFSDFMRTHSETWEQSKQLFTEDQLDAITGLLVSPNYYA